ncbi:unnamed protein product, partial [Rhizoctonia solani]
MKHTDPEMTTVISRTMPIAEVLSHLTKCGIPDLTNHLDLADAGTYPLFTGGSSDIYYGQLHDSTLVTIKIFRLTHDPSPMGGYDMRIISSIHKWSKCRHPNLHELLGFTLFHNRIGMVSPWMRNGDLPRYLRRTPWANRFDLCVQICEGVSHLHHTGIVHGDIKGANVLISDDGVAMLTDFDEVQLGDSSLVFTRPNEPAMTLKWTAPEVLLGGQRTFKSDVYGLGMV